MGGRCWLLLAFIIGACAESSFEVMIRSTDATNREDALQDLGASRNAWDDLERMHGSTYWYVEGPCDGATGVQVVDGQVTETVPDLGRDRCPDDIERAEPLAEMTIPELYDHCRGVLNTDAAGPIAFAYDARGVMQYCVHQSDDCEDDCDSGVNLLVWGFGQRELDDSR